MLRHNLEAEQASELITPAVVDGSIEQNPASDAGLNTEEINRKLAGMIQQSRSVMWYGSISALFFICSIVCLMIATFNFVFLHQPYGYAVALLLLCGGSAFAVLAKRESRKQTGTYRDYDDVCAIGPLMESLFGSSKSARTRAAANLTSLLPRLRVENKSVLNRGHRRLLAIYLGRSRWNFVLNDDELSIAILKAYHFIGDGTELPVVKRLAQGKVGSARDERVRVAAQAYLDEVNRRKTESSMPGLLLRPSDTPATSSDVLLRVAAEPTNTDPQQLLRAESRTHDCEDSEKDA